MLRAVVFDVDGTLAETEELHRRAFNRAFAEAGLGWRWDRPLYARLLATAGGRERIAAHAAALGQQVDAAAIHRRKTAIYDGLLQRGGIGLRPGVAALIAHARGQGLALAIGTTTSRPNVLSLLETTLGADAAGLFASIRTGEDVMAKKPDPEVYRLVLSDLGLSGGECLCVEDSRNGLLAARAAGMRVLVTPGLYGPGGDLGGADLILRNLAEPWSSAEFSPYTSLIDQPGEVARLLLARDLGTGAASTPSDAGALRSAG